MRTLKSLTLGVLVLLFCVSNIALAQAGEVERLINQLKNESQELRNKAGQELYEIGKPAVEPLIVALKHEHRGIRQAVAYILGHIGDKRAVKPLISALKDKDRSVRKAAIGALVRIGKPAVKPLITALKDENRNVRSLAAKALDKLGWKAKNKREKALYLTAKERERRPIAPAQADEVERLINQLKDEYWRFRGAAVVALGRIGDPRAVEPLVSMLKDESSSVRGQAAEALGEIGDRRAVEPLITALKDKAQPVRYEAAEALGKIGDPRAVVPLISALKDENIYVRGQAAEALGKIGGPRAVKALITALKDESSGVPADDVAAALGKIGDRRAVKPLIAALKDIDDDVREEAAEALGKIGDRRAAEPLIAALKDEDRDVREKAAEALIKIGKPAVEPLTVALKDEDYDVREKAAEILGKIGDKRAVPALTKALRDETLKINFFEGGDEDVVESVMEALKKIDPKHLEREIEKLKKQQKQLEPQMMVIFDLDGEGKLLVTDPNGKHSGYKPGFRKGKTLTEIPKSKVGPESKMVLIFDPLTDTLKPRVIQPYTVEISGSPHEEVELAIFCAGEGLIEDSVECSLTIPASGTVEITVSFLVYEELIRIGIDPSLKAKHPLNNELIP